MGAARLLFPLGSRDLRPLTAPPSMASREPRSRRCWATQVKTEHSTRLGMELLLAKRFGGAERQRVYSCWWLCRCCKAALQLLELYARTRPHPRSGLAGAQCVPGAIAAGGVLRLIGSETGGAILGRTATT